MTFLNNDGVYETVILRANSSRKYADGSFHENSYGKVEIVGSIDRVSVDSSGIKRYKHFLIKFDDRTFTTVLRSGLDAGSIKNLNLPNVCDKGFIGQGKYKSVLRGNRTKAYDTWSSMIRRCYDEVSLLRASSYNDCEVSERWLNFQNFCDDIKNIEGYHHWVNSTIFREYDLDKDIKVKGNRVYSKETCIFAPHIENMKCTNPRITGDLYLAENIKKGLAINFFNQTEFAKNHNLLSSNVWQCINKKRKSTHGWRFSIQEPKQAQTQEVI